jgi:hypothetical protein
LIGNPDEVNLVGRESHHCLGGGWEVRGEFMRLQGWTAGGLFIVLCIIDP